MRNRTAITLALGTLLFVGAACSQQNAPAPAAKAPEAPTTARQNAACPGTGPACPSPQIPDCQNGKWVCVGPARPGSAAAGAKTTPKTNTPTSTTVVTVTMNNGGFSPSTVTVNHGTTVTFLNLGTKSIWPASNPHPVHTDYPGFDPKHGVAPTESWNFTFNRVGTWGYHDHLSQFLTGTIIVK